MLDEKFSIFFHHCIFLSVIFPSAISRFLDNCSLITAYFSLRFSLPSIFLLRPLFFFMLENGKVGFKVKYGRVSFLDLNNITEWGSCSGTKKKIHSVIPFFTLIKAWEGQNIPLLIIPCSSLIR